VPCFMEIPNVLKSVGVVYSEYMILIYDSYTLPCMQIIAKSKVVKSLMDLRCR
jgi:hypothetical protein